MRIFRNKGLLLLMATALIVLIIIFSSRSTGANNTFSSVGGKILSPFQSFASWIGEGFSGVGNAFESSDLQAEVDKLTKENQDLKQRQIDYDRWKNENETLRDTLKLQEEGTLNDYDKAEGKMIAKNPGNLSNSFTINIGESNGVKVGYTVFSGCGLVGRIIQTGTGTATVLPIIDPSFSCSGIVSRTSNTVERIHGDIHFAGEGLCRLDYGDQDLEEGDMITTSDSTGIYPVGLVIGVIKEVFQAENEADSYAIIQPEVDFSKLRTVFVLIPKVKK